MSVAWRVVLLVALAAVASPGVAAGTDLTADQALILEKVRASALAYAERLPDFICTQITHRETSRVVGVADFGGVVGDGRSMDAIEERLTYYGQKESYQLVSINGKKAEGVDRTEFTGTVSGGEFGSTLREIFAPQSGTVFTWVKMAKVNGHHAYVFGFRVPQANGASVTYRETNQQIVAAFGGEIAVDEETLNVLRISSALELPTNFPVQTSELTIAYQPIKIDDKVYVLPVHSEVRVRDLRHQYVNRIEFRNFQKFGAQLTIHYDGQPQP